ncbi:diiron oxygenase [Pseudoalteromonas sp. DL2-H2.2]|uniref:Diiron oxygenase n=1 Tax=Pseudoalteromonas rubra TaxID=43658 RepID=A0A0F4QZA1_9GAMM|nr:MULTISPECIES: diiron oxygenase [Pseudoalteromonas]KJZ13038.1 hypothetical protein TW77_01510 [Pseudoalteromonas rubra]MCF2909098.1 diiron oxygenase [Pseudoalteromonas sp. DL2-H2.2]
MTVAEKEILTLTEARKAKVAKLCLTSHAHAMDLETVLPWDKGIDKSQWPKEKDHLWIYGTPYYDQLTEEQRLEVAWLETARDISMFIWLEQTLPPLYMGYINKYYDRLDEITTEYLMVFSKEEIVHTMTFKRFMELADLKIWTPPDGLHELLIETLPNMQPAAGVLFTLLIEWVAELGAMHTSQGSDIEPMTRQLFKAHHFDEARHIAFGRWISENYFETAPKQEQEQLRAMAKSVVPQFINMFTYNNEISKHTSFEFPIQSHEQEKINEIWASENNIRINNERFAEFYAWLDKLGLR